MAGSLLDQAKVQRIRYDIASWRNETVYIKRER